MEEKEKDEIVERLDGRVFDETIELKDNAMLKHRPELFDEWNFKKNDELGLDVYKVTKGIGKKVWWVCKKCSSEYDYTIPNRINGYGCPYCTGRKVNHTNSLFVLRPDLIKYWDYKKNKDVSPHEITPKNSKKVWWICGKCDSSYDMSVYNKNNEVGCPYCSGQRANHTNSLFSLNPKLADQWHPTLNKVLTPHDVTPGSSQRAWWLGKCGHEWDTDVSDRVQYNTGCPYCSGNKILIGFNDMWTTNPDLAGLLAVPEDGYRYMQNSSKRTDWKCGNCGEDVKNKSISTTCKNGLSCPNCTDGFSYPEKFMYNLLRVLSVEFEWEKVFKWSQNKRYDFYLTERNWIIEVHGRQHYEESLESRGGEARTLKEEKENDILKERLAKINKVENYTVVNASVSDLSFLRNQILNSNLADTFDLSDINWSSIHSKSTESLVLEAGELWNEGESVTDIMKEMKLSRSTITKYLRRCVNANLCDYDGNNKKIVQLTMSGQKVKEWRSASEASKTTGINKASIGACFTGKTQHSGGFKWVSKEDYESFKRGEKDIVFDKPRNTKKVVQMTMNGDVLKIWNGAIEAGKGLGLNSISSIYGCCGGYSNHSHNFKWLYLTDYEKEFGKIVSTE